MKIKNGFVLPIILMYLLIFYLLGLASLKASLIENKISLSMWKRHSFTHEVEAAIAIIAAQFQTQSPACIVILPSANELISKPISWWKTQSCTGNFHSIQYYYVVETFGPDACANIGRSKTLVADYYRVSFLGVDSLSQARIIMQGTIIKPVTQPDVCESLMHSVTLGAYMFHELIF